MTHDRHGDVDGDRGDDVRTDASGIIFSARETSPQHVETVSTDGHVLHRVPWSDVRRITACDPWPRVRVTYYDVMWSRVVEELAPLDMQPSQFADHVAALVAAARTHAPHAHLDLGWLAAPDIEWERIKRMPHDVTGNVGDGAYRTTTAAHGETVEAHRPVRTPLRAFLDWLGSHPGFEFREQPLEVVVTDQDVYARFRDESIRRVPRAELRASLHGSRNEVIYIFGRRARLLLPHLAACPVEALLDATLATHGRSGSAASANR